MVKPLCVVGLAGNALAQKASMAAMSQQCILLAHSISNKHLPTQSSSLLLPSKLQQEPKDYVKSRGRAIVVRAAKKVTPEKSKDAPPEKPLTALDKELDEKYPEELPPDFWDGPQWNWLGFVLQYLWAIGIVVALITCGILLKTYTPKEKDSQPQLPPVPNLERFKKKIKSDASALAPAAVQDAPELSDSKAE